MKVASVYIDKKYITEKLGIDENQFVFGDIEGDSNEIQFKVFIDSDAEVKSASPVIEGSDNWSIRRQRLEDMGK